jgi:hypothetical protein
MPTLAPKSPLRAKQQITWSVAGGDGSPSDKVEVYDPATDA